MPVVKNQINVCLFQCPQLGPHLLHQLGVYRINRLEYVLPWHQDRLDIFHVGIARLDPVGQVVLVPSFDLNMQRSICLVAK